MAADHVHAFGDDALGEHDAVALAALIRSGEISAREAAQAALVRARQVEPQLHAVAYTADQPLPGCGEGLLAGVPTYVKDNTDVQGMPTNHGTAAFQARPATRHGRFARQLLSTGVTVLGKSRLPEFGFNAGTEFADAEPTHNPWHTGYSPGASSGGAAALVAAGVVPLAHGNDGGGSLRIPAACCGLVGLKPTRGRHINGEQARTMPVNIISEGVITRTVRDTAIYLAAAERSWRNPALPPIGQVEGPASRRLRIGLVIDSIVATTDAETSAAVRRTATVLGKLGHDVEELPIPMDRRFVDDFTQYWGLLAFLVSTFGRKALDPSFDAARLDGLTVGLSRLYRKGMPRTPALLYRLSRVPHHYAEVFRTHDVVLSPTLAHVAPRLGHLSPNVPFDELLDRLRGYVGFTPLNNVAGSPAISLPAGLSAKGLPIGVQLSATHGDERTLLELAYALEAEQPWARIDQHA